MLHIRRILILLLWNIICSHIAYKNLHSSIYQIYKLNLQCLQSTNTDSTDEDRINTAEQLRINTILKQQGITIDDVRKLKDAISSGSRYNKRENTSPAMKVKLPEKEIDHIPTITNSRDDVILSQQSYKENVNINKSTHSSSDPVSSVSSI